MNDILFVCIIYNHDDMNKIITFIDHIVNRMMDRNSIQKVITKSNIVTEKNNTKKICN